MLFVKGMVLLRLKKIILMILVMAVFTIKLNEYFLDTFIKVLSDELNKLEHKNSDKIKDVIEIDNNKVPESRRYSSKN